MPTDAWTIVWDNGHAAISAWLLTYALHSTLLLVGVWVVTSRMGAGLDGLKESLWKFAVIGGAISATLQTAIPIEPLAGRVALYDDEPTASPPTQRTVVASPILDRPEAATRKTTHPRRTDTGPADDLSLRVRWAPTSAVLLDAQFSSESESDAAFEPAASAAAGEVYTGRAPTAWWRWLSGLCVFAGGVGVGLVGLAWVRLCSRLADRREIADGPLPAVLTRLCHRARLRRAVRLTCSKRIPVPMAFGIRRPEICLPMRAVTDLPAEQQESMLAHELAHLVRGDPAWMTLCGIIEKLFFFQPLNRLARRRLQELAEFRCDLWAVEQTGAGLPLARCLTEVADWLVASCRRPMVAGVSPMAAGRRNLQRRIERLLDGHQLRSSRRHTGRLTFLIVELLAGVTMVLPALSIAQEEAAQHTNKAEAAGPRAHESPRALGPSMSGGMKALDQELAALEADLGRLRKALRDSPLQRELAEPVDRLETQTQELHHRRERLRELIPKVLPTMPSEPHRRDESKPSEKP